MKQAYYLWDGDAVVYRGSHDDCVRFWEQNDGPPNWTLHKGEGVQ
jgi:hypothetical protein